MSVNRDYPQTPDTVAHERTYHAFNMLLRWCMVSIGALVLTLILLFGFGASFLGALIVGGMVFGAGYFFIIRHETRQPLDVWKIGR